MDDRQERYFVFADEETCYACSVKRYGQDTVDKLLAGPENTVQENDLAWRDIEHESWPPGDQPGSWVCEDCGYELVDRHSSK